MLALLHNVQSRRKPVFACHALEGDCTPCNLDSMRIRLKEFRNQRGWSLEDMAERSGYSVSQLSRWETGDSNIPSERLPKLAAAYECRIADIFEEDDSPFVPLGPTLYVRGIAQAGNWQHAWDEATGELGSFIGRPDVTVPLKDRFGIRVEGDSMNDVYPAGTIVECISFLGGAEIRSGRRVVVSRRRNGDEYEVTVKEYVIDENGVEWLFPRSSNPAFQAPMRMDQQEPGVEEVRIVGIVVGSYRPE